MHHPKCWSATKAGLPIVAVTLMLVSGAWAATEQVLYSFTATTGQYPQASLIFDGVGNLYGTAAVGGNEKACPGAGCGVVFELTPASGGGWTETVLHTFDSKDGAYPIAPLVFDQAGNLYGTTQSGGQHGYGVVFELTPATGGGWTEKVLHSFTLGYDGAYPMAGLAIDAAGNLYGTAEEGGQYGNGVAFELLPTSSGWRHNILHSFGLHGTRPVGGLVLDHAGNLYGTTSMGGSSYGHGLVFELTPNANGPWNEIVLYKFRGKGHEGDDGAHPFGNLIFDGQGNLYGTTLRGGPHHNGRGVIFKLSPSSGGTWTETILHYGGRKGGYWYHSGLIFDAAGNLYGTAEYGGGLEGGVVFRLTPTSKGFWKESVLHSFGGDSGDGVLPVGGLVFDEAGNLYGTTQFGGTSSDGTVFEVTP
jgi:uncharacterized repeat protein (TIGR03803 family)